MNKIDYAALDKEYGDKIVKRTEAYGRALSRYKSIAEDRVPGILIDYREDMPVLMAYFAYYCNRFCAKPFIKGLSDRYKIASITELTVCFYQPLNSDSKAVDTYMLNAQFAVYCAFNIMENFRDNNNGADPESMHFSPYESADRFDCNLVDLKRTHG